MNEDNLLDLRHLKVFYEEQPRRDGEITLKEAIGKEVDHIEVYKRHETTEYIVKGQQPGTSMGSSERYVSIFFTDGTHVKVR